MYVIRTINDTNSHLTKGRIKCLKNSLKITKIVSTKLHQTVI